MTQAQPSRFVLAVSAIATLLLSTPVATATDQAFGAVAVCDYGAPNLSGQDFGGFGEIKNLSDGTKNIKCAVGQDNALDTNDDVLVYFTDGNTGSNNLADVSCHGSEMLDDGSVFASITAKYGCNTAGGCSSPTGGWSGSGEIRLADARHGGSYYTIIGCNLPAIQASSISMVYAITIDEQ